MKALVVGGTGPTGPFIVNGLIDRGYEPVILHRGSHEVEFKKDLEHIHVDPHFAETLEEGLEGRTFDLCVGMYGRLRLFVDVLQGKTDRLITVGGTVYKTILSKAAAEDDPRLDNHKIIQRIVETEKVLDKAHEDGLYNVTHFRYPNLYGERQLAPREWSIIRRIRDGRRQIPMLDAGLTLESRSYVENASHAVLLAVDKPEESAGRTYNVADEYTPSDADRVKAMADVMGADIELVNFPAEAGKPGYFWGVGRTLTWGREGEAPTTDHQLLSIQAMKDDMGYRDVVDFPEAIRRTVQWYLDNPPEPGGEEERQIGDPFDYEAEDKFFAAQRQFVETVNAIEFSGIQYEHPYAHPKAPSGSDGNSKS